ncbi:hypothetical protein ACFFGV_01350 [Pontibacillus salicampi]|uniref:Zinc ribbon domain-containing protein n=1 Tax=Pontibacillus salicampi TaxID=1449801 RepID=A0ABV6LIL9_9BACI
MKVIYERIISFCISYIGRILDTMRKKGLPMQYHCPHCCTLYTESAMYCARCGHQQLVPIKIEVQKQDDSKKQ